jgi:cyclase
MSQQPKVHSPGTNTRAYEQPTGGWFLNNAGWIGGGERTLIVDTCATEARTARLLAAQLADTGHSASQLSLALTHWHGDHVNGANQISRAGGTVMATAAGAEVITSGPHLFEGIFVCENWGDVQPPEISTVISEPTTVDLGGASADVLPVPWAAHTVGDLIVHVPDEGVLFTGDLVFVGVIPLVMAGTVDGWIKALDWMTTLPHTALVPGHGPMQGEGSTAIADMRAYLSWLQEVTAGESLDFEALETTARERWADWSEGERHIVNLTKAHAEQHGLEADQVSMAMTLLKPFGGPITLDI